MGKKNRNRGRDRYDDIYDSVGGNDFEYDENFQNSYQDEIENVEFIDADSSKQDSGRNENTYFADKNSAKSQAAEERDSWDFIKAKMDQTLSKFDEKKPTSVKNGNQEKNGTKQSVSQTENEEKNETEQNPKEVKPKGPSPVTLLLGKVRTFVGALGTKLKSGSKRKAKPENSQGETETTEETSASIKSQNSLKNLAEKATEVSSEADVEKEAVPAKKELGKKFFSFLKKTEKNTEVSSDDAENSTEKTANEVKVSSITKANKKGTSKADETENEPEGESVGSLESSVEAQIRQKRKTYLILGSITMSIVGLLLIGIILLIVGKSGKEVVQTPQNAESATSSSTDSALSTDSSLSVPPLLEIPDQENSLSLPGSDSPKSETIAPTSETINPSTAKTTKTVKADKKEKEESPKDALPQSLDSDLGLGSLEEIGLPNDSSTVSTPEENSVPKASSTENPQEDLTVADVLNSADSEASPTEQKKVEQTSQTEQVPDSVDSLLASENSTKTTPKESTQAETSADNSSDLSTPEDSGNTALALPELNEASLTSSDVSNAVDQSAQTGSALTEETPSLETSPESAEDSSNSDALSLDDETTGQPATPGTVTVAPTIARAENANTLPEGLETPEGVTPGSNVEEWNSSPEEIPESFTAPQNPAPTEMNTEEKAGTDSSATPSGEPTTEPLAELSDSPAGDSASETSLDSLMGDSTTPLETPAPLAGLSDSSAENSSAKPSEDSLAELSDSPKNEETNELANSSVNESAAPSTDPLAELSVPSMDEPAADSLSGNSDDLSMESSGDSLSFSESRPEAATVKPTETSLADDSADLNMELSNSDESKDSGSPGNLESGATEPSDSTLLPSALGSLKDQERISEKASGKKEPKSTYYTSVKDDSFWKISEKFYQTPAYENALIRANIDVVPDPNNLKPGTILQIPELSFLRSCYPTLCPPLPVVAQVPAGGNGTQVRGVQFYCVSEGDTLSQIAERLLGDASRWPEIYRMNTDKIQNLDLLPVGEKLQIPMDEAIPSQKIWQ